RLFAHRRGVGLRLDLRLLFELDRRRFLERDLFRRRQVEGDVLDDFLRPEQLRLLGGTLQRRLALPLPRAEVELGGAGIQIEADLFELWLRRGWRRRWWRGRVGG